MTDLKAAETTPSPATTAISTRDMDGAGDLLLVQPPSDRPSTGSAIKTDTDPATPATIAPAFVLTPTTTPNIGQSRVTPEARIKALEEEAAHLRAQLGDLNPDKIIKKHIDLLHTYNEIKDGTQALIGRYAAMDGKTIKQVHIELGLPLSD